MMDIQVAAQHLFEEFGTLVLLGMPPGTEFGIDLNTWNVGDKFKGVKMIPPGLHFIYFSAVSRQGDTAPRTGFFHFFESKDLVVRHYDAAAEDLIAEDPNPEELERFRANLRNLDRHLGPYPMDSWEKWVSLTQYVTEEDFQRMMPLSGKICSVLELTVQPVTSSSAAEGKVTTQPDSGEVTAMEDNTVSRLSSNPEDKGSNSPCGDELPKLEIQSITEWGDSESWKKVPKVTSSLPEMIPKPGTELRFSKLPSRPYREGASPSEITRCSLDSSYSVKHVIEHIGRSEGLLSELQFAFVCFLAGQVWDGWEHWRLLLTALCSAEEFLLEQHPIYLKLLSVIHFQVQEVPEDLFVDIVESNNFLATALKVLFANISDNSSSLPVSLVTKALRFRHHLGMKFGWILTMEDEGEDAPVIIETENLSPVIDST